MLTSLFGSGWKQEFSVNIGVHDFFVYGTESKFVVLIVDGDQKVYVFFWPAIQLKR